MNPARSELGQVHLTPEPLAGLARVNMTQGDLREAQNQVREIFTLVERGRLYGIDEAAWVYLTCYQVLHAIGDPLARQVLEAGYLLLAEGTNRLNEEPSRKLSLKMFLATGNCWLPGSRD